MNLKQTSTVQLKKHPVLFKTARIFKYIVVERLKKPKKLAHLYWNTDTVNLGDQLSPIVLRWVLEQAGISPSQKTKRKTLLTIGSIMTITYADSVVWGSGILRAEDSEQILKHRLIGRKLDIRAVRGPETRRILKEYGKYDCPEIYGDPAVFMPLIYSPQVKKQYPVSVIPHYKEKENIPDLGEYHFIDIETDNYRFFIDEICKSELIVSSSLHGIILAESYGVPALFLHRGMEYSMIKYLDWYYSTGRYDIRMINSLKDETRTMIFYESPYRLLKTLGQFAEVFGPDREVCVCREISKVHEEYVRGTLAEVKEHFEANAPRGEIVIVLAGHNNKQ